MEEPLAKSLNVVVLKEMLQAELEFKKKYCSNLEETLQNLIANESFNLTQRYSVLKETNEKLMAENSELKSKIDDIIIQAFSEQEELRENLAEKLLTAKAELAALKVDHEKKIQDLYTEMYMIQASAAVQSDETLTNLQHQFSETSAKFRETTSSLTNLKTELRTVKEDYAYYKSTVNKDMVELKRQLEWAEEQLKLAKSKQRHSDDQDFPSTSNNDENNEFIKENTGIIQSEISANNFEVPSSTSNEYLNKEISESEEVSYSGKYKPLQVYCKGSNNNHLIQNRNTPRLYKGTKTWGQSFKYQGVTNKKTQLLPPLIDCSGPKICPKITPRKRKLYDPDDLSHLEI